VALVLDTGVLYAALDLEDPDHDACAELIAGSTEPLLVPAPVLVELEYWVRKRATADAWLAFCEDVHRGSYVVYQVTPELLLDAAKIQARFEDQDIGLVDAVVFQTCESLGEPKVATLDHRHFSILRTSSGGSLELLP